MKTLQADTLRQSHFALCAAAEELRLTALRLRDEHRPDARESLLAVALELLREDVLPHLRDDEAALYSGLADHRENLQAISSMRSDRLAIRNWIDRLAAAGIDDGPIIEELLFELHALIETHVWKEQRLFRDTLQRNL